MNLQNPRRSELTGIPFLNNALDMVLAAINAIWAVEHNEDGTHGAITATSVTATDDVGVAARGAGASPAQPSAPSEPSETNAMGRRNVILM